MISGMPAGIILDYLTTSGINPDRDATHLRVCIELVSRTITGSHRAALLICVKISLSRHSTTRGMTLYHSSVSHGCHRDFCISHTRAIMHGRLTRIKWGRHDILCRFMVDISVCAFDVPYCNDPIITC